MSYGGGGYGNDEGGYGGGYGRKTELKKTVKNRAVRILITPISSKTGFLTLKH